MKIDYADLIGIPYKEHGRSKKDGFDCYGLVIECEKRHGKILNDSYYNGRSEKLSEENAPSLNVVKTDVIQEGTILEMRRNGNLHIGFALNENEFIHCTENQGVRVSHIDRKLILNIYEVV